MKMLREQTTDNIVSNAVHPIYSIGLGLEICQYKFILRERFHRAFMGVISPLFFLSLSSYSCYTSHQKGRRKDGS